MSADDRHGAGTDCSLSVSGAAGQREIESRPLAHLRLDPDAPAIALNHALTDRKTNAATGDCAAVKYLGAAIGRGDVHRHASCNVPLGGCGQPAGESSNRSYRP